MAVLISGGGAGSASAFGQLTGPQMDLGLPVGMSRQLRSSECYAMRTTFTAINTAGIGVYVYVGYADLTNSSQLTIVLAGSGVTTAAATGAVTLVADIEAYDPLNAAWVIVPVDTTQQSVTNPTTGTLLFAAGVTLGSGTSAVGSYIVPFGSMVRVGLKATALSGLSAGTFEAKVSVKS